MPQKNDENQLNLAIQALQKNPNQSSRAIARIYSVDHRKLGDRLRGILSQHAI